MTILLSVGIFCHNEEKTIGKSIDAFLLPLPPGMEVAEIFVVCCACTDGTVGIATERTLVDPRVRVIERAQREGKVVAINTFLQLAKGEIFIISGGDILPRPHLVERLVEPLHTDPGCTMTGGQVVTSESRHRAGRLHTLLWRLHHEVACRAPKLGESIAVRRKALPSQLPSGVNCDEVLIEAIVLAGGGRLTYVPEARVQNYPPDNLSQLYNQRRRIACQHLSARQVLHYRPSTEHPSRVIISLITIIRTDWRSWRGLSLLVMP
jgi:cellulose synthase/poly-beta-1,6-N-acetylglucosamine synthase-like glycosyltransferase